MGEAKQEEAKVESKPEEKAEEKKEEKAEEKKEEEKLPPPPVVLFVDMHCVGCAKRVERCIMKFRGVESIAVDMTQNQVTVKGVVEPQALCLRIQNKTKRKAKVLSPLPAAEGESTKPEVVLSQVSGLTTVELNVNMHCEACAQQLKRKILKMRGVQTAETDLSSSKVTVTGTMDANKLVDYVYRRTRKLATIVPQPEEEKKKDDGGKEEEAKPEEKKEESALEEKKEESVEKKEEKKEGEKAAEESKAGESNNSKGEIESKEEKGGEEQKKEGEIDNSMEEIGKKMMYWRPIYVIEHVPAPQLFSDENPNACCIS
ncbi:heavy metal-associated isoprenylated plant protein 9-like [Tasmannia lanceolata]|uniref:heavy metal-associated isoprenylated plant protein 9-like n=1 Tax=Tasmannia lanceolata TaxID=3420 RepID=UPI004064C6ED